MIDLKDCYNREGIYLKNGKLWKVASFWTEPVVSMVCIDTCERETFGIRAAKGRTFEKVDGIYYNHTKQTVMRK